MSCTGNGMAFPVLTGKPRSPGAGFGPLAQFSEHLEHYLCLFLSLPELLTSQLYQSPYLLYGTHQRQVRFLPPISATHLPVSSQGEKLRLVTLVFRQHRLSPT